MIKNLRQIKSIPGFLYCRYIIKQYYILYTVSLKLPLFQRFFFKYKEKN